MISLVLFLPGLALIGAPQAEADSVAVMATLPHSVEGHSVAWDGSNAYVFGGCCDGSTVLDTIVRYDPGTNSVSTMSARLPTPRSSTGAAWDGTNAYIFGGVQGTSTYLSGIVRYNPSSNTVTTMGATLPSGRAGAVAVWDGTNVYVFGGSNSQAPLNQIVRYNPATDTATIMNAVLPSARSGISAVWDGTYAYIFGGVDQGGAYTDQIVRYHPATDTASILSATLPSPRAYTAAAWDGTDAYVFGGQDQSFPTMFKQIVRFNPGSNSVTVMAATLPFGTRNLESVWGGANAYIFGGCCNSNQIWRYDLAPGAPTGLTASRGPAVGQMSLALQAPAANSYSSPLTHYRVFRSETSGGPYSQIGEVVESVRSFTDSGLPSGAVRYYVVRAVNADGQGAQSAQAVGSAHGPPTMPRQLSATRGPGVGEIRLAWLAPSDDGGFAITNYRIYRGTSSGALSLLAEVGNVLSFTDSGLPAGAVRFYAVRAVNSDGAGSQSNEVAATAPVPPSPPRQLTAARGPAQGEITLDWLAPADNGGVPVTGYRVFRGESSGTETFVAQVGNVLTFRDSHRALGAVFFYRVTAVNGAGEGTMSNEVFAPGSKPPSLANNPDGSCTLFNDSNGNGGTDTGEAIMSIPCPNAKVLSNPDGSTTLYDDQDDDNQVDPGETLLTTPPSPDQDRDGVPDALEPALCAEENPFFNFDGTCTGGDYHAPTLTGVVEDVLRLLG